MGKPVGAKMLGKSVFTQVSKLTTRFHTNYKKQIFTMKRADTHQLKKVINVASNNETNQHCVPLHDLLGNTHTDPHLRNNSITNINLDIITREKLWNRV